MLRFAAVASASTAICSIASAIPDGADQRSAVALASSARAGPPSDFLNKSEIKSDLEEESRDESVSARRRPVDESIATSALNRSLEIAEASPADTPLSVLSSATRSAASD